MKWKQNILICLCKNEEHYYFTRDGTTRRIPKEYSSIIRTMNSGVTDETDIIGTLKQNDMSETEAVLLCAEFMIEYSEELESE